VKGEKRKGKWREGKKEDKLRRLIEHIRTEKNVNRHEKTWKEKAKGRRSS
jgi:hypothetical protein